MPGSVLSTSHERSHLNHIKPPEISAVMIPTSQMRKLRSVASELQSQDWSPCSSPAHWGRGCRTGAPFAFLSQCLISQVHPSTQLLAVKHCCCFASQRCLSIYLPLLAILAKLIYLGPFVFTQLVLFNSVGTLIRK